MKDIMICEKKTNCDICGKESDCYHIFTVGFACSCGARRSKSMKICIDCYVDSLCNVQKQKVDYGFEEY